MKDRKPRATPGNKYGTKLKEAEVRQEAYKQYCDHIASGYPKEAFFFLHPTHSVCWRTMERYIKESPSEFQSFLMDAAKSARYRYWLEEGKKLMQGKYKAGSPVVWQTCMRNIFRSIGWDAQDKQNTDDSDNSRLFNALMNQVKSAQDRNKEDTNTRD